MDHLSAELSTLSALARRERPSAGERAAIWRGIEGALEEKAARARGEEHMAPRRFTRPILLVSAALALPLLAVMSSQLTNTGGHERTSAAVATASGAAVSSSASAVELARADDPAATLAETGNANEHRAAAQRRLSAGGSVRHRASSHRRAASAEPGAWASQQRSREHLASSPPNAAPVASAAPESAVALGATGSGSESARSPCSDGAVANRAPASSSHVAPERSAWASREGRTGDQRESERVRAQSSRQRFALEAAARYEAALGERARLASAQRPLTSAAWF